MCYNVNMGKTSTKDVFIEKANKIHNGKYDYSQVDYVNSRTKVIIICPKHGSFVQLPSSHIQGNGCPMCMREWTQEHKDNLAKSSRKSRGMTTEQWIERARKVHGNKYDYSQTVYINQRTDVKIICPMHGMFTQKADSHIRGSGCKLCGHISSSDKRADYTWSDDQRQKIASTCLARYGAPRYLDSSEGKQKVAKIKSTDAFRDRMREIISSDAVQTKTKATCYERYGVTSAMKLPSVLNKNEESKRRNGTWSTSEPEENMYVVLCNKFGKNDVFRQHKDSIRYPFRCDFYIESLDLFIELNATWLHGLHWFDEKNEDDLKKLHNWKQRVLAGHSFYQVAINVWTVRDVKKHKAAIDNNLNYLVFWKNDLSDFYDWLNSDQLILCNI